MVSRGRLSEAWCGREWSDEARQCMAGVDGNGTVRRGVARHGGHGGARQARLGSARPGTARRGAARQARRGMARRGLVGQGGHGEARRGKARLGKARRARHSASRRGNAWTGGARFGNRYHKFNQQKGDC